MMNKPYLVVEFDDKSSIDFLIDAMFLEEKVSYMNYLCKVIEVKVNASGSKQYSTYRTFATVKLEIIERKKD